VCCVLGRGVSPSSCSATARQLRECCLWRVLCGMACVWHGVREGCVAVVPRDGRCICWWLMVVGIFDWRSCSRQQEHQGCWYAASPSRLAPVIPFVEHSSATTYRVASLYSGEHRWSLQLVQPGRGTDVCTDMLLVLLEGCTDRCSPAPVSPAISNTQPRPCVGTGTRRGVPV
jgi:hypothetical protein